VTEITAQRTRNQKVFDLGNKSKRWECHAGPIHYQDSGRAWQEIDTTLNLTGRAWSTDKHASPVVAPDTFNGGDFEYHGWNDDHELIWRPVGGVNVPATMDSDIWGSLNKAIVYPAAYGVGIDFVLRATNFAPMAKIIRFNTQPIDVSQDLRFSFELRGQPGEWQHEDGTVIDNTRDEGTAERLTGKVVKLVGQSKESYIWQAKAWDSGRGRRKQRWDIPIYVYRDGTQTYLVKIVPKEVLQSATYPLYVDDPVRYDPPAGDGYCEQSNATWDTAHDATTSTADYTGTSAWFLAELFGGNYVIQRCFLPMDTSGITDTDTITAAVLNVYADTALDDDNDATYGHAQLVQTSQAGTTTLVSADYDNCGSVDNPTEGAARTDLTGISTTAYTAITLDATGRGWVDKTGDTLLGLRAGWDALDSTTGLAGSNGFASFSSEQTGTSQDPYLEVTSTAASNPKGVFGLPLHGPFGGPTSV
jgi:uncharacterized protein YjbJ (UPF0337 family)